MPQIPFVEPDGTRRAVAAYPGEGLIAVVLDNLTGTVLQVTKT